jgi:hypothetical protein
LQKSDLHDCADLPRKRKIRAKQAEKAQKDEEGRASFCLIFNGLLLGK